MGQMLSQFLEKNRDEIVALTEEKTLKLAGRLPSSAELRRGLPIFFEHLIDYLRSPRADLDRTEIVSGAADHGRELLKLNKEEAERDEDTAAAGNETLLSLLLASKEEEESAGSELEEETGAGGKETAKRAEPESSDNDDIEEVI